MGGGSTMYPQGPSAGPAASESRQKNQYKARVNEWLQEKLKSYKRRDVGEIRDTIDGVVSSLNQTIQGRATAVYGGSVAKGTFVEGLSDHDVVVRLPGKEFEHAGPSKALEYIAKAVRSDPRYTDWGVSVGEMAVTMKDPNGREIQLVPAITQGKHGQRVKEPGKDAWSQVTQPKKFAKRLSKLNHRHGGRVNEAIKLFKDLQTKNLPKEQQMNGYHVEAVAYMAFRNYRNRSWVRDEMLHTMVRAAAGIIQKPITDPTGQSRHVDDAFGEAGSARRRETSQALRDLAARMSQAKENGDAQFWEGLL